VKRRDVITLIGSAAAASLCLPRATGAQQRGGPPSIGFLGAISATGFAKQLAGFRQGLHDLGYSEGANLMIEYRWAEGEYARLPALVTELVRSNVAVIVTHGTPGTLAAKRTTTTTPIVAAIIGDPISTGVVSSIARPGGNITGQSFFNPELRAKRIEFLKEMEPGLAEVAILFNPDSPAMAPERQVMEATASSLGVRLRRYPARSVGEFEDALDKIAKEGLRAVEIGDDALMNAYVGVLAELTAKRRLASIGPTELARAGGVIGYGVDFPAAFRRAPVFIDRILKGAKPADLPFERATRFECVVNLRAAKTLGLDLPAATLLRADEVIE
jgi:putative ABC transport system substrate-binding protein